MGLGQLAHPDHFDSLPGEHGPGLAGRGGPDVTGLAEHDVENFRGRAARILDRHEIVSAGGDGPAPPRRGTRSAPGEHLRCEPEPVTLVPVARAQRLQNRLAAALT